MMESVMHFLGDLPSVWYGRQVVQADYARWQVVQKAKKVVVKVQAVSGLLAALGCLAACKDVEDDGWGITTGRSTASGAIATVCCC